MPIKGESRVPHSTHVAKDEEAVEDEPLYDISFDYNGGLHHTPGLSCHLSKWDKRRS